MVSSHSSEILSLVTLKGKFVTDVSRLKVFSSVSGKPELLKEGKSTNIW